MKETNYSFLVIGSTKESTEAGESFKRYVGVGSSYVLAVNPTKAELEKIEGREIANDPEYLVDGENGKEARIVFSVKTDPESNNGIEITNRAMFILRNTPSYNRDNTKVQVIDKYGNFAWAATEDAKAHKALGGKIDAGYRIARVGECALVDFLKNYLVVPEAYSYQNGNWVKKSDEEAAKGEFMLENIDDYFKGDFSEVKGAIALQPNNKVKLLYGVRTTDDNKQYQTVCTREQMTLKNNSTAAGLQRLEKQLMEAKNRGAFPTTEYKVQELAEYTVEPTNMAAPEPSEETPW